MRTSRGFAGIALFYSAAFAYACSSDAPPSPAATKDDAGPDAARVSTDGSAPVPVLDAGPLVDAAVVDAAPPPPPNTVVQLALGTDHTCALLQSGDVWCWGGNVLAQQGNGTVDSTPHAPAKVAALSSIVGLTAGNHHTCAVDALGVVRCWGGNQIMELGHDNTVDDAAAPDAGKDILCSGLPCNPLPREVTGLGAAKAVAAKLFNSCARLANGTVKCWGYNGSSGMLGHAGPDLACFFGSACNFNASLVSNVSDGPLALGSASGCVLTGGTVSCWGDNNVSELAMASDSNPHITPVAIMGLPSIAAIGAGNSTRFAVGSGGALYGWGSRKGGELGDGCDAGAASAPQMILEAGVTAASGGAQFACALSSSGLVTCWGTDVSGPLGPTVDVSAKCQPPTVVGGLVDATQIGLGFGHVCAVKTDNSIWCWGYNQDAQCGHDPSADPLCNGSKCDKNPTRVVGLP